MQDSYEQNFVTDAYEARQDKLKKNFAFDIFEFSY